MIPSSLFDFFTKPSLPRSGVLAATVLGIFVVVRNGSLHQLYLTFAFLFIVGTSLYLLVDRESRWRDFEVFVPAAGRAKVHPSFDYSSSSLSSNVQSTNLTSDVETSPYSHLETGLRIAPPRNKRIIVAVTGATGALLAIRLLEILKELGIETHLILSKWAVATLKYETDMTATEIRALATTCYQTSDMAASPSSGSFLHDGMVIVPCSMKTLSAVRTGYCSDLITRSADVCMKEGRKLLLVVRETPFNDVHLENMLFLRRAGAVIFPPVPAFYIRPKTIDDIVNQSVGRILDQMGIHVEGFERWSGFQKKGAAEADRDEF